MTILHTLTAPTGAPCAAFRVLGFEFAPHESDLLKIRVGGWAQEADALGGAIPLYNWFVTLGMAALNVAQPIPSLEAALTTVADSPWLGGTVVPTSTPLDEARTRRWALIKLQREEFIARPIDLAGVGKFDADPKSAENIKGAVQLAILAQAAGQPWQVDWTMFDNSVRSLTAGEVIALGQALGQRVDQAHQTARTLRAAIEAAQTVAQLEVISWPVTP